MIDPVDLTVASGRAALAASTWGDTGQPLVALHPGVADRRVWGQCAPVWAAAGHRVVAYDRRGFGDTRAEEEPHDDIADLLAVTAATAARPAVLVGNSRGGRVGSGPRTRARGPRSGARAHRTLTVRVSLRTLGE